MICPICGKEFMPKRKFSAKELGICSNKCRMKHFNDQQKEMQSKAFLRARAMVKENNGIGI